MSDFCNMVCYDRVNRECRMSVLIKGMQMPPTCSECRLAYDFMACGVTGNRWYDQDNIDAGFDSNEARLPDCPLKEIPEKHGDLIDRSALSLRGQLKMIKEAEIQIYGGASWGFVGKCITAIDDAPAIIEAE